MGEQKCSTSQWSRSLERDCVFWMGPGSCPLEFTAFGTACHLNRSQTKSEHTCCPSMELLAVVAAGNGSQRLLKVCPRPHSRDGATPKSDSRILNEEHRKGRVGGKEPCRKE